MGQGEIEWAFVYCPAGKTAIGGWVKLCFDDECSSHLVGLPVVNLVSHAHSDGSSSGWYFQVKNEQGLAGWVRFNVICASVAP